DNGTEFARHQALHPLAIKTFFCDPYAPWQKGGIENAIGRLRRFIPRKTDLAILPGKRFRALLGVYNNTPRKCLDFSTPAETFSQLLHFECESTSPLARGRRGRRSTAKSNRVIATTMPPATSRRIERTALIPDCPSMDQCVPTPLLAKH